ncbi:hypothetical protein R3P38DRAFT_2804216 [Favolaschia claudopus]|uniref:Uncharacterized protein n=1 Tax=Favolaschia claudopus TaxID=2862362 RepID=A0AAV9ZQJ9_9AGAR
MPNGRLSSCGSGRTPHIDYTPIPNWVRKICTRISVVADPVSELQHVWPSSTSSRTLAIETKSNGIIGFRFKTESGMAGGISFPPPILSPDHADRALFIAALAIEFEEDVWKDVIYKEGWVGKPTSSSCGENCSPDLGVAEKKTGSIKFS